MLLLEITSLLLTGISVLFFLTGKDGRPFRCFLIAIFTVGIGEALNHLSATTIYNPGLMMLPLTEIPIFIVPAGAALSGWVCRLSLAAEEKLKVGRSRFVAAFLFSLILPLISELTGVSISLWRWNIPFEFSLSFLAGIWKFYLIFLLSPAFLVMAAGIGHDLSSEATPGKAGTMTLHARNGRKNGGSRSSRP